MNQQFQTRFLLEELDGFESLRNVLLKLGADKDAIELLVDAVKEGRMQPSDAIRKTIETTGLSEEGGAAPAPGGGTTSGGNVTDGATFTPGDGEQMTGRKGAFKKVKQKPIRFEDAPILAGGKKANIKTYTQDGFTKVKEDAPMLAAGTADISTYTQDGFTKVKGHPKLKSIDIKDLWDEPPTAMTKEDDSQTDADFDYTTPDDNAAATDGTDNIEETWLKTDYPKIQALLDKIKGLKDTNSKLYDTLMAGIQRLELDLDPHTYDDVATITAKAGVNENYHRFKRETRERPKQDQYHQAIKEVHKKLDEVNRILEFTSRMKEELSEGGEMLEVRSRTAKTMDKLKTKIAEAYQKLKNLN